MERIYELFQQGGPTMYALLLCSIVCIAVVIERAYTLWAIRANVELLLWRLREYVPKGRIEEAKSACLQERGPIAEVASVALENIERPRELIEGVVGRAIATESSKLERYLPALATIGVIAPLLGLFGTVLGIMNAFRAVAEEATVGPTVVAAGVAEALITTAFGLAIGVVAYVAYNYFVSSIGRIADQMEVVASEVLDLLAIAPERPPIEVRPTTAEVPSTPREPEPEQVPSEPTHQEVPAKKGEEKKGSEESQSGGEAKSEEAPSSRKGKEVSH